VTNPSCFYFLAFLVIRLAIIAGQWLLCCPGNFAYMSVDRTSIWPARAAEGGCRCTAGIKVYPSVPSFMLSGAQLGNHCNGLMVGFCRRTRWSSSHSVCFCECGRARCSWRCHRHSIGFGIGDIFQMIFVSSFPKNAAIANPSRWPAVLARLKLIYLTVFGWLIGFFRTRFGEYISALAAPSKTHP